MDVRGPHLRVFYLTVKSSISLLPDVERSRLVAVIHIDERKEAGPTRSGTTFAARNRIAHRRDISPTRGELGARSTVRRLVGRAPLWASGVGLGAVWRPQVRSVGSCRLQDVAIHADRGAGALDVLPLARVAVGLGARQDGLLRGGVVRRVAHPRDDGRLLARLAVREGNGPGQVGV